MTIKLHLKATKYPGARAIGSAGIDLDSRKQVTKALEKTLPPVPKTAIGKSTRVKKYSQALNPEASEQTAISTSNPSTKDDPNASGAKASPTPAAGSDSATQSAELSDSTAQGASGSADIPINGSTTTTASIQIWTSLATNRTANISTANHTAAAGNATANSTELEFLLQLKYILARQHQLQLHL